VTIRPEPSGGARLALHSAHARPRPVPPVTELRVGVVDVYVVHPGRDGWSVLVLQRAAEGTRCSLAWETVHGRIEPGERPEEAAVREVREETGLAVERLYNVTTQAFYLHGFGSVQLAVVFCAFVAAPDAPTLGPEHGRAEWLPPDEARARFAWPREREAIDHVRILLGGGDAGPLEDVLRVI
jgi:dihydroneopterin triphosphate diphosphatase